MDSSWRYLFSIKRADWSLILLIFQRRWPNPKPIDLVRNDSLTNLKSTGKTGDVEGSVGSAGLLSPLLPLSLNLSGDPVLQEFGKVRSHFFEYRIIRWRNKCTTVRFKSLSKTVFQFTLKNVYKKSGWASTQSEQILFSVIRSGGLLVVTMKAERPPVWGAISTSARGGGLLWFHFVGTCRPNYPQPCVTSVEETPRSTGFGFLRG